MTNGVLKKLAKANGMKVAYGIAYGCVNGYAVSLSRNTELPQLLISTRLPGEEDYAKLQVEMNQQNICREYGVRNVRYDPKGIFVDFSGTPKQIQSFLERFLPTLSRFGATGAAVCAECGETMSQGTWVLIDGTVRYMHDACLKKLPTPQVPEGSYLLGTAGAILGSILGSILWAVVLYLGYMASIVGFVIGFLAEKGYNLLHGKQGNGKKIILILALVLGVVLGTLLSDVATVANMINEGELAGAEFSDIPMILQMTFQQSEEYRTATLGNMALGLIFAIWGAFALLAKTKRDALSGKKIVLP